MADEAGIRLSQRQDEVWLISLPEKRRQGDWNQASQLSRDHSYKENKQTNKQAPRKTSSFPLVPLNEITSFSEEWGGAFQTFHVLRQQRRKTGIQDFHTIQSQDLTETVQHLRLQSLKSNLIFLGVNCLTPSQEFSRTEDLHSSAVTASHFQTGWIHREGTILNCSQVKSMCVMGQLIEAAFLLIPVIGINRANSVLEWSGFTYQETVNLQKCWSLTCRNALY